MRWNPAVILYNVAKKALAVVTGQDIDGSQPGLVVAGLDAGAGKARFLKVDATGRMIGVNQVPSTAAARSTVPAAQADTLLFSPDATRQGALVYNDSNSVLFVGLGSSAVSLADFTYPVAASTLWEVPEAFAGGEVRGIWTEAQGSALLTALVLV
jgi:hypothetical protein